MRGRGLLVVAIPTAMMSGCTEILGGPCYHTNRESVLQLTGVSDAATGRSIGTVYLDSLTYQGKYGRPVEIATGSSFESVQPQFGVSAEAGRVRCEIACGFGSSPGTYRFLLSAVGYVPKPVLAVAEYREFHGGCPSWNDGGTRFTFTLVHQ